MKGSQMTHLQDQIRDDIRAEEHSAASIVFVSAAMIIVAIASLTVAL